MGDASRFKKSAVVAALILRKGIAHPTLLTLPIFPPALPSNARSISGTIASGGTIVSFVWTFVGQLIGLARSRAGMARRAAYDRADKKVDRPKEEPPLSS